MHWILRREETRKDFFTGVRGALKVGGTFVFEMGGMGNVAEVCLIPPLPLCTQRLGRLERTLRDYHIDACDFATDAYRSPQRHRPTYRFT